MSSSIDNVECPLCGGNALRETDTKTGKIHTWCTECDYDSDVEVDDDVPDYDNWPEYEDDGYENDVFDDDPIMGDDELDRYDNL